MKKIKLFGDLAQFDTDWQLHVKTPSEALRAIEANRPGFLNACNDGDYVAMLFDINEPDLIRQVTLDNATSPWGDETLLIIPRAGGEIPAAGIAALIGYSSAFAAGGITAVTIGVTVLTIAVNIGLSLAITALANIITGSKQAVNAGKTESYESHPSFISNGPVNLLRAGNPYPLLVGHVQDAGSIVLSSNYWVEDIAP